MSVFYAVLALGGLGAAIGVVLAAASLLMRVKTDPRLDALTEALPGINCGGCGYQSCAAFAAALSDGAAGLSGCPVGGRDTAEALSGIMGAELGEAVRTAAMVRCSGGVRAKNKFQYEGIGDCHAAMRIGGGPKECAYGCVGLGSCVKVCPFGAVSVVDDVAVVDPERCTACLTCAAVCPKGLIVPVPQSADVHIACSSREKGGTLRKICDIGCLGCRICEKVCIPGAVTVEDNVASIDFEKCTGCGDCAEKCPRKLIVDAKLDRGPRLMEG